MEKETIKLTQSEKLHKVFDKYKDKFVGNLHGLLWIILMEERYKNTKKVLVQNFSKHGIDLGLAEENQKGYLQTATWFAEGIKYDEAAEILDDMNQIIFDLTPDESSLRTITTMGK